MVKFLEDKTISGKRFLTLPKFSSKIKNHTFKNTILPVNTESNYWMLLTTIVEQNLSKIQRGIRLMHTVKGKKIINAQLRGYD